MNVIVQGTHVRCKTLPGEWPAICSKDWTVHGAVPTSLAVFELHSTIASLAGGHGG